MRCEFTNVYCQYRSATGYYHHVVPCAHYWAKSGTRVNVENKCVGHEEDGKVILGERHRQVITLMIITGYLKSYITLDFIG